MSVPNDLYVYVYAEKEFNLKTKNKLRIFDPQNCLIPKNT